MNIDAASFAVKVESETLMCHGHKQILQHFWILPLEL